MSVTPAQLPFLSSKLIVFGAPDSNSLGTRLAGHDLGDGMANSDTGLLDILLGQRRCDANSQSRLGKPSAVLRFNGVGIRSSLGPCDQNAIGESLCKSVVIPVFKVS